MTSGKVHVSLISFLLNLPCGLVVCDGAQKRSIEKKERKKMQQRARMVPCSWASLYTKQHAHEIGSVLYCDGSACCIIHKYGGVLAGLQREIHNIDVGKICTKTGILCLCVSRCAAHL